MKAIWIEVSNIHCEDCKKSIKFNLEHGLDENFTVKIINNSEISIILDDDHDHDDHDLNGSILNKCLKILLNLGFIIKDYKIYQLDLESNDKFEIDSISNGILTKFKKIWFNRKKQSLQKKSNHLNHLKNCSKCRFKEKIDNNSTIVSQFHYKIGLNIGLNYNQLEIEQFLFHYIVKNSKITFKDDEISFYLDNKQIVNTIITNLKQNFKLNDVYILKIEKIDQENQSLIEEEEYKLEAIIGGISCAACTSSISTAIKDLPFLNDFSISIVSKTANFYLKSQNNDVLDQLIESIEDCGFEFKILNINKISNYNVNNHKRFVNLKIIGMYCENCPLKIVEILSKYGDVENLNEFSLDKPIVKFNYIPSESLKLRSILKELYESNGISVEFVKNLDIDEQLRLISKLETKKISYRLVLTFIIAIPTFIFGIIGMSLLSRQNPFKIWLDEAIWCGNVSRIIWILFILSTPVFFFATDIFHIKAFKEIKSLWLNNNVSWFNRFCKFGSMNLLMSLGTTISYFASIILLILSAISSKSNSNSMGFTTTYFDSVVFLTFFLLIGRLLESYSKSKTAESISNLGSLKPSRAILLDDSEIDLNLIELDDLIKIKPGDSPPLDCIIMENESNFDESALTGESKPILRGKGEQIFTGTINKGPQVIIGKISTLDGDSLIDQIINTVRDGQMKRAPVERIADVVTGYFVPIIIVLAILTWIIWLSLGLSDRLPSNYLDIDVGGWYIWSLEFAIAVFVIACPCGIGLAAPTAIFVGIGIAAKNGILARGGGIAFQECGDGNIDTICFDKTGTLTKGELNITNFAILSNKKSLKNLIFTITRDLENSSSHPIANSVKNFINNQQFLSNNNNDTINPYSISKIEEIPGRGLKSQFIFENIVGQVLLGNESLMKENQVSLNSKQEKLITTWKLQGKSIVIVSFNHKSINGSDSKFQPVLIMGCRDQIRPESKKIIELLKKRGLKTWMITGDNEMTAMTIAKELGIDNVLAQVLPEEKGNKIKWLQNLSHSTKKNQKSKVCMVGDGINDSIALSTADIGISLSSGSELAISSSDFVLLSKEFPLVSILTLFELSTTVIKRIFFNFGWAIVYNLIGIPIAAGVIYPIHNSRLSPVWASAAMALSSISVVLSSLSLKFFKKRDVNNLLNEGEQLNDLVVEDEF
ncbi:hypothetical protein WICMUC_001679 [Wickerhamomyces mucosus]|uniref:HMA domain-containing protein n=1 Tax=Wickerhamomyces mucosus TaxID=1378264 RepID=A0A9P8PUZ9_9ASCO|nr:hypothetical protein WICMUC_001679 [Wickerhamomyces mucosus]